MALSAIGLNANALQLSRLCIIIITRIHLIHCFITYLLPSFAFWEEAMATPRFTMRKIRDVLRLRLAGGLSIRQINASTKVSIGAIQKLLSKAATLELGWPLPDDLNDVQLTRLLYPDADTGTSSRFQIPDWPTIHQELKRKGMTKLLLWEKYTQQCSRLPHFRTKCSSKSGESSIICGVWLIRMAKWLRCCFSREEMAAQQSATSRDL